MKTVIAMAMCIWTTWALPGKAGKEALLNTSAGFSDKITSGVESVPHSHPYIVGLYNEDYFTCGGSILSPEWVVTAAHCMDGVAIQSEKVLAGAHNRSANENEAVQVGVAEVIIHEDWDSLTFFNDIALIRLEKELQFTEAISSIQIAPRRPAPGSNATVIGWGSTNSVFSWPSNVLMEVDRPIAAFDDCASYFGEGIDPNTVCLDATNDQGACSGDSGGPLVVDGELVGAVSFGSNNILCRRSKYGAYTGLPELTDWICDNSGVC